MSQPIGMLYYMDEKGVNHGVEVTEISEIQQRQNGARIIKKNRDHLDSIDSSCKLLVAYDNLVKQGRA